MKNKYKKSYLIINIILILTLIFFVINFFVFKNTSFWFSFFSLLIPTSIIIFVYGYEKKKRRYTYEEMFLVFIYSFTILITTYIIGIFTGFNKSIYNYDFINFIHNIIPYLLVILISEVFRYEIIRKGEKSNLSYILITIILIVVDITLFSNTFNLDSSDGQIRFICSIVLPSVSKNIFLLYLTKNGGIYPSLIYRLIMDLKVVLLPIFPFFGIFFESMLNVIIPFLMGLLIHFSLMKYEHKKVLNIKDKKNKKIKIIIYVLLFIVIIDFNMLISGQFKYGLLAIGSESMRNYIDKGDVVFYKKIEDNEKYNIGDILIFKKDDKIIVHRIIKRVDIKDDVIYYTKGDNNMDEDGYPIQRENIVGVFKYKIKYMGIPSIFIKELFE